MDEHHNRGSPRLQFSKEELENDTLSRPIARAEKAADRYDAARKKLRKHYRLKLSREEAAASPDTGSPAESAPDLAPPCTGCSEYPATARSPKEDRQAESELTGKSRWQRQNGSGIFRLEGRRQDTRSSRPGKEEDLPAEVRGNHGQEALRVDTLR